MGERRGEFGIHQYDTNDQLAVKLKYILDAGMSCCFCIGEPKEIRERGLDAVLAEMHVQLTQIYSLLDPAKVVIAYEPVWALAPVSQPRQRTHRRPMQASVPSSPSTPLPLSLGRSVFSMADRPTRGMPRR